jgi:hypothetical protein
MSKILPKVQISKQELSISQILRIHGKQFKQIQRDFSDERNGRCAMGVILSYYGWDGKLNSLSHASPTSQTARRAMTRIGISGSWIMKQNDSGYTFDEIADYIERYYESLDYCAHSTEE